MLDLYLIDYNYIEFLSSTDNRVLSNHTSNRKFNRPHLGIVIKNGETNQDYWRGKPLPGFLASTVNFKLLEQKCQEWITGKKIS